MHGHYQQSDIQLTSLCENVSNLAGSGGGRQSPTCSPTTTIGAVSKLAQEHSETNGKLTTTTQQLEQVNMHTENRTKLNNALLVEYIVGKGALNSL